MNLACGIAHHKFGHPGALYVQLHLYAYNSSNEERYEQHDGYGIYSKLYQLAQILSEEHAHAVGACKHALHEHEIFSERAY